MTVGLETPASREMPTVSRRQRRRLPTPPRDLGLPLLGLLPALALAGTIAATVAIAGRTRLRLVAFVHLATGTLLCGVAWLAFSMVRHAGVRALGVLPVAAVRPGPGLRHFVLAALCVVALGVVELVVALLRRRGASTREPPRRVPGRP